MSIYKIRKRRIKKRSGDANPPDLGVFGDTHDSNSPAFKKRKGRPQPASFQGRPVDGLFHFLGTVQIGAYACFICGSLVVFVIAFAMPFGYTCVAIRRKENSTIATKKNLCAQIDIDLHRKITEAKEQAGLTTAEYITNLLIEYYEMKENGGKQIMAANGTRTMAFQIPEDLFQRIKAHLERETARTGKKLTQREFVLGLIEEALEAAEDNELNAEILSELMDMEGARCELAVNGQEAKGLSILAS